MQRYNPKDIEPKWQAKWEADKIYEASEDTAKPKKYILEYFPYPSGAAMHVGHVRNYTIGDVLARHSRMTGHNVLHPMGWDAFGLPAENYAIKTGVTPRQAIDDNTSKFKQQLIQMGFSYDWSREIDSTDPKYYRWTQWFFLLLLRRGLAYQQESLQWWCPVDKTVLANEQVEAGLCWRCGNQVEKKLLKQWFFKITDYADRLARDLDDVNWSDSIKAMQRNWIGRSVGAEVDFAIDGHDETLKVFTTRPDTLFGATFMVLSPEHELVGQITTPEQQTVVAEYAKAAQAKSDIERQETNREKTGVFTGAYAINPVNREKIPIWIADYVMMGYGTGAIMAVPAHDERDYEFATKFDLPIRQVIAERLVHNGNPHRNETPLVPRDVVCIVVQHPSDGTYLIAKPNGSEFWSPVMGGIDDGESAVQAARRELLEESGYTDIASIEEVGSVLVSEFYAQHKGENRIAYAKTVVVKLGSLDHAEISVEEQQAQELKWATKDEVAQLCVGAGAPEIYAMAEGINRPMVYEGRLINSGEYTGMLSSDARELVTDMLVKDSIGQEKINYKMRDWLISRQRYWGAPIPVVHCPKDGAVAVPEDQLPVVLPDLDRIEPSGDGRSPLANVPEFVQTTCPTCGGPAERETDTMDGFACSSWYFLRFADPHNDNVPFDADKAKFWLPVDDYIGGAEHAVMHLLYARFWTKVMHDEGMIDFDEPFATLRNHGMILAPDGSKMSKSKGNTIEPSVLIDQGYGADSVRIMELFLGPWNQSAAWSIEGMGGAFRFLQRVWTLVQEYNDAEHGTVPSSDLNRALHKAIKKVSEDIETMSFNTAIASLMELVNELFRIKAADNYASAEWQDTLTTVVQLLAPLAPHISEELWVLLGKDGSVHTSIWPVYDDQYLRQDSMTIVIQVNGKLRGEIVVASDAVEADVVAAANSDEKAKTHLDGKTIRKTIYVSGKLVNFVV